MIFIKNIIKKKNFNKFIITLSIVISFMLAFISLESYLDIYRLKLKNTIEKRTIIVYDSFICDTKLEHIISCEKSKEDSKLIVDDSNNIDIVLEKLEDYDTLSYNNNDDSIDSIILIVKGISYLLIITCIIITVIVSLQFKKDDKKINKIMRCIGYSRFKLFIINSSIFNAIISLIVVSIYAIFIFLINIIKIDINIFYITIIYLKIYLSIVLYSILMYYLSFLKLKKIKLIK